MLIPPRRDKLKRTLVLNPKGGCGKSTLVTNLAAAYAQRGPQPAVMDFDPQGSTMAWLDRRPADLPPIHGIAAYKKSMHATRMATSPGRGLTARHPQLAAARARGYRQADRRLAGRRLA